MRILISMFRCSRCKMPVKSAMVEFCPKCGARLITNHVSKSVVFLTISMFIAIIIFVAIAFSNPDYYLFDGDYTGIVLAAIIGTVPLFIMIIYLAIKNKRRTEKDEEYVGTGQAVELEHHLSYGEISLNKKYLIAPILSVIGIGLVISITVVDIIMYDFLNIDDIMWIVIPTFVFLIIFVISIAFFVRDFSRKMLDLLHNF